MNERIFDCILAGRTANILEPDFLEPNILEFSITPTLVSHEVHHQNFKYQQRHPSRNS